MSPDKTPAPIRLSDGTQINPNSPLDVTTEPRPRGSGPLIVLMTIAVLGVMYIARDVIVPVVVAVMLALLLRPALRRMKKWQIPNGVSALVLVGATVAVFVASVWSLAGQAQAWLAQAPQTLQRVKSMIPTGEGPIGDIKKTTDAINELTDDGHEAVPEVKAKDPASTDWAYTAIGVSGHFLGASMIVFVLAYFLLALSDDLLKQMVASMPSFFEKRNVVELVQNVERGMSRYLATITVINIGLGVVTAFCMWLLGLTNYVLWGVMATTLNYVPHVGAFIALCVLFFVGALEHQSLWWGAAVASVFALLTTAESYFITPMMLSRSLELSPLAVILSILFFGWLWGVGGGLLAAPLLAVIKIVCDQFETTSALGSMLGTSAHAAKTEAGTEKDMEPPSIKPSLLPGPHARERWPAMVK